MHSCTLSLARALLALLALRTPFHAHAMAFMATTTTTIVVAAAAAGMVRNNTKHTTTAALRDDTRIHATTKSGGIAVSVVAAVAPRPSVGAAVGGRERRGDLGVAWGKKKKGFAELMGLGGDDDDAAAEVATKRTGGVASEADRCPCGGGDDKLPYSRCCKPYHKGEKYPQDCVTLMRSRITGYAKGEGEYVVKTTHPENPIFKDGAKAASGKVCVCVQGDPHERERRRRRRRQRRRRRRIFFASFFHFKISPHKQKQVFFFFSFSHRRAQPSRGRLTCSLVAAHVLRNPAAAQLSRGFYS